MLKQNLIRNWLLALALFLFAVTAAGRKPSSLFIDVDYARFRINEQVSQVEFYLSLPRDRLKFVADKDEYHASFECQIAISIGDSEVVRHDWVAHTLAVDTAEVKPGQLLFTQANFQLPVNSYNVAVRVVDLNDRTVAASRSLKVNVEPFEDNELDLSDLEISSKITRDTTWSPFFKNQFTVVPNPGSTYGLPLPMLYVYCEIYNLSHPSDSSYTVHYRIFNGDGKLVKALPPKSREIMGTQLVEVGGLNILSLRGGTYTLEVRVTDHSTAQEVFKRRKFFIYREDQTEPVASAASVQEMAYELMMNYYRERTEQELDDEFATTVYISSDEERKIYSSLDVDGKRDFITNFWLARDLFPETPQIEYRSEYLGRVKYANENYSGFKDGWKTDRGRVLLIYGRPDDWERFPNSSENIPYEIWKYFEYQGGVDFIFADVNKFGDFRLVHSTARGELYDVDWQRWINPGRSR